LNLPGLPALCELRHSATFLIALEFEENRLGANCNRFARIGAGNSNPNLDKEIHVLDFLSGEERADLQAFMESLTGEMPPNIGPPEAATGGTK
jgi:hypothetical protein